MAEPRTLRLAHRGDWRVGPENSIRAVEAALRVPGCDGIELDIRCSSDGVPVLLHDETLARVQKVPAACVTLTAAELAEHGIPTLTEVLAAVECDVYLDVELKEPVQGAIDALELERGRSDDHGRPTLRSAVVSSFDGGILRWLAAQRPTWPRWLNAYDLSATTVEAALDLGCSAVSVEWHEVDEASVERARDAGLGFAVFTVRDNDTYRRMEALGAIAICAEGAALDG